MSRLSTAMSRLSTAMIKLSTAMSTTVSSQSPAQESTVGGVPQPAEVSLGGDSGDSLRGGQQLLELLYLLPHDRRPRLADGQRLADLERGSAQ